MVCPCSGSIREHWMFLEDQAFSPSFDLAPPPLPPPSVSFLLFLCVTGWPYWRGGGGGGMGEEPNHSTYVCAGVTSRFPEIPFREFSLCANSRIFLHTRILAPFLVIINLVCITHSFSTYRNKLTKSLVTRACVPNLFFFQRLDKKSKYFTSSAPGLLSCRHLNDFRR